MKRAVRSAGAEAQSVERDYDQAAGALIRRRIPEYLEWIEDKRKAYFLLLA